jgi:hypothetical protein
MNKQELIKEFREVGIYNLSIFGAEIKGIPTESAIALIEQLDEPETGHADEAPRYLKNILARLRELPLHNREVWLKVIMSEFKQDFSHAKWREGYEQGKLEGMAEREKVKVPQCVADVIEGAREQSPELEDALHYTWGNGTKEFTEWYNKKSNRDLFARAWLDGYEVEEEKRYLVKVKGMSEENTYLTFRFGHTWMLSNFEECEEFRLHHTRKELEEAGFGWVFSCEGIEMEEV